MNYVKGQSSPFPLGCLVVPKLYVENTACVSFILVHIVSFLMFSFIICVYQEVCFICVV